MDTEKRRAESVISEMPADQRQFYQTLSAMNEELAQVMIAHAMYHSTSRCRVL